MGVIEASEILPLYTLSHEPGIGFAADGAARAASGIGVVAVTYGAGALNLVNPIAAAFAEQGLHHTYKPPAQDGSRPGIFEVNVSDALEDSTLDTLTVCYHEALPGHHLQLAIAQELEGLPALRRMVTFDAYIEGWAKYAETLPWEHGWNRDPYWNLARMRRELVSTANLALDTGIHHKGWTRDEGLRFFEERTGSSAEFTAAIVDRIAATPAQTCSYKIGMLAFFRLRDRMRRALGDGFDIRRFHDTVLEHGSLPLEVLEDVVGSVITAVGESAARERA